MCWWGLYSAFYEFGPATQWKWLLFLKWNQSFLFLSCEDFFLLSSTKHLRWSSGYCQVRYPHVQVEFTQKEFTAIRALKVRVDECPRMGMNVGLTGRVWRGPKGPVSENLGLGSLAVSVRVYTGRIDWGGENHPEFRHHHLLDSIKKRKVKLGIPDCGFDATRHFMALQPCLLCQDGEPCLGHEPE